MTYPADNTVDACVSPLPDFELAIRRLLDTPTDEHTLDSVGKALDRLFAQRRESTVICSAS
jgi:hypothetical protein